jgi:hypothetical protein
MRQSGLVLNHNQNSIKQSYTLSGKAGLQENKGGGTGGLTESCNRVSSYRVLPAQWAEVSLECTSQMWVL